MGIVIPKEKGPTIMFIGILKAELPNWTDLTVKQHIWTIDQFLMINRTERLMLLRLGAIRLTAEEAKEAIMEELHLDTHDMVTPRTKTDRHFRISVVRANDPDHPLERPGFKFFK
eukprot:7253614-Heterocapsa_arctica.AAC.1